MAFCLHCQNILIPHLLLRLTSLFPHIILYFTALNSPLVLTDTPLEQPTDMSLSHWTINLATTEPVGTLPAIVMVVSVAVGGVSRTKAEGTVKISYENCTCWYNSCLPKRTAVAATLSLTRSVDDLATIDIV